MSFFGEIYYTVQCDAEQKTLYNTLEWIALVLLLIETAVKILAVGFRGFLSVTTWKMDAFLFLRLQAVNFCIVSQLTMTTALIHLMKSVLARRIFCDFLLCFVSFVSSDF